MQNNFDSTVLLYKWKVIYLKYLYLKRKKNIKFKFEDIFIWLIRLINVNIFNSDMYIYLLYIYQ